MTTPQIAARPGTTATGIPTRIVARYKFHQHTATVFSDGTVDCGTCAIGDLLAKAMVFAAENHIHRMMFDGAEFSL
jgi:hypothetical protein